METQELDSIGFHLIKKVFYSRQDTKTEPHSVLCCVCHMTVHPQRPDWLRIYGFTHGVSKLCFMSALATPSFLTADFNRSGRERKSKEDKLWIEKLPLTACPRIWPILRNLEMRRLVKPVGQVRAAASTKVRLASAKSVSRMGLNASSGIRPVR